MTRFCAQGFRGRRIFFCYNDYRSMFGYRQRGRAEAKCSRVVDLYGAAKNFLRGLAPGIESVES